MAGIGFAGQAHTWNKDIARRSGSRLVGAVADQLEKIKYRRSLKK